MVKVCLSIMFLWLVFRLIDGAWSVTKEKPFTIHSAIDMGMYLLFALVVVTLWLCVIGSI